MASARNLKVGAIEANHPLREDHRARFENGVCIPVVLARFFRRNVECDRCRGAGREAVAAETCGTRAAVGEGGGNLSGAREKEVFERKDRIGDVEQSVVVEVAGGVAREGVDPGHEEILEHDDGVGDVDEAVGIAIAAYEILLSVDVSSTENE